MRHVYISISSLNFFCMRPTKITNTYYARRQDALSAFVYYFYFYYYFSFVFSFFFIQLSLVDLSMDAVGRP